MGAYVSFLTGLTPATDATTSGHLPLTQPVQATVKTCCSLPPPLYPKSSIAAGSAHTVALKSDGTVRAWGSNNSGQLGDGTTTDRLAPVKVTGLDGVTAIAAGLSHTVALKSDGTVWAWGLNNYGQLGDGTYGSSQNPVPTQVPSLGWGDCHCRGSFHTVALKSDGTVWAWGYNVSGQLGDGTTTDTSYPGPGDRSDRGDRHCRGMYHTVALKSDGTVWAWGRTVMASWATGRPRIASPRSR